MRDKVMNNVLIEMIGELSEEQFETLKYVLFKNLVGFDIIPIKNEVICVDSSWQDDLSNFLVTKAVEGKSKATVKQYKGILCNLLMYLNKNVKDITTDDLFKYMTSYKIKRNVSNRHLDNMRLIYSSFFTWMFNKGYISSNPVLGLNKIKVPSTIKKPFTETEREILNRATSNERDLALMEFLYSTGIRVGELIKLNRDDINFSTKDLIVIGKGSKERQVYINEKSCVHVKKYLECRKDDNEALFVSLNTSKRLSRGGVESILKRIGDKCGVQNVHPHRFRRTMATNALNKGMPLQEVQVLLGHAKSDTTLMYCTINQENVKHSHKKYIA